MYEEKESTERMLQNIWDCLFMKLKFDIHIKHVCKKLSQICVYFVIFDSTSIRKHF